MISTQTLSAGNDKTGLTKRQLTNRLINLKIDILDSRNITGENLSKKSLHLDQPGSNLLTKSIISNLRKF